MEVHINTGSEFKRLMKKYHSMIKETYPMSMMIISSFQQKTCKKLLCHQWRQYSRNSLAVPSRTTWRRALMPRQPYSVAVLSTGGRLHPSFLRREGLVRMWSSLWLKGDGGIRTTTSAERYCNGEQNITFSQKQKGELLIIQWGRYIGDIRKSVRIS